MEVTEIPRVRAEQNAAPGARQQVYLPLPQHARTEK